MLRLQCRYPNRHHDDRMVIPAREGRGEALMGNRPNRPFTEGKGNTIEHASTSVPPGMVANPDIQPTARSRRYIGKVSRRIRRYAAQEVRADEHFRLSTHRLRARRAQDGCLQIRLVPPPPIVDEGDYNDDHHDGADDQVSIVHHSLPSTYLKPFPNCASQGVTAAPVEAIHATHLLCKPIEPPQSPMLVGGGPVLRSCAASMLRERLGHINRY